MADRPIVEKLYADNAVVARHVDNVNITFPSGLELERVFATVPARGPKLVGREQTFHQVRARILRGGSLARSALHGLPGVGKTALALELAYDEATLKRFDGGVLWAGLGPKPDIDGVLSRWAAALGVDVSSEPMAERRAQRLNGYLQAALAGRPVLLILDDAWSWEAILPFLNFTMPEGAVLLTSRDETLARRFGGAQPIAVHELGHEAAVDLLTQACPEARAVDPAGLCDLAEAVGGLPLALVLMGAYLAAHVGQDRWIRAALDTLKSVEARLALTDEQRRPGLVGMPLSLRAVVELSVEALPDEVTQTAFDQLAVFAPKPADFSREATLAVWQAPAAVGDTRLRTLRQRGLLEAAKEDRFTLHQVLAAVAEARSSRTPEAAADHFSFYLSLVQRDPEDWAVIEPEMPQIQRAWAWVSQAPGWDSALMEFVGAMRVFLGRRGLWDDQLAWFRRALEASRVLAQRPVEAVWLNNVGSAHFDRGELDLALDLFQQALSVYREVGSRGGEGVALTNLGKVYLRREEVDAAVRSFQEAAAIHREVGNRTLEARTVSHLAEIHKLRGDLDVALQFHEQALAAHRAVRDREGKAATLNNMGHAHQLRGDIQSAMRLYEEALATAREIGVRGLEATALHNIGAILSERKDPEAALDRFREALAIQQAAGDRAGQAVALNSIGDVYLEQGEHDEADRYLKQALLVQKAVGAPVVEARILGNLGVTQHQRDELAVALSYLEQALALHGRFGSLEDQAKVLSELGVVHRKLRKWTAALRAFEQARSIQQKLGTRRDECGTVLNIGILRRDQGDLDAALRYGRQALAIARELVDMPLQVDVLCFMVAFCINRKDAIGATAFLDEIDALHGMIDQSHSARQREAVQELRAQLRSMERRGQR